jgi:cob(I)alamin adenosyltransferase
MDAQTRALPGDRHHPRPAAAYDGRRKDLNLVRLGKIYTRTGDNGETGLVDGSRIPKDHVRARAIGDVDEANSAIGLALLHIRHEPFKSMLDSIQNELFDLGADLATPGEDFAPDEMTLRIVQAQIDRLEREIDSMNGELEPLRSFILPGAGGGAAQLHLARTIVRRAEREAVAAAREVKLNPLALRYLNRLSDHLFVLARRIARDEGGDILWKPGATRER